MTRKPLQVLTAVIGVALLSISFVACGGGSSASSSSSSSTETGGSTSAASSEGKKISIGIQVPLSELPVYVGLEQEIMQKHGISEVEWVAFTDVTAMGAALAKEQIDMIFQSPVLAATLNKTSSDAPLKLIAPGIQNYLVWVAGEGSDIPPATDSTGWKKTVAAFKGKEIGVPAKGGLVELMTKSMAEQVGLSESEYTLVTAGTGAAAGAALKAGVADVISGTPEEAAYAETVAGGTTVLDMLEGQGPPEFIGITAAGYLANEAAVKADPELYSDFIAAYEEANEFLQDPANQTAVEETMQNAYELKPAQTQSLWERRGGFDTDLSIATLEKSLKAYETLGLLEAPAPKASELLMEVSG